MKKLLLSSLVVLSALTAQTANADCCRNECTPENSCDYEITSRSYLAPRPNFQSASPELIAAFRFDRNQVGERHSAVQAVLFGGKTTNDRDLARYFLPFGKTDLIVDERIGSGLSVPAGQPQLKPQDLLAQHFSVRTINGDFRSQISIRPQQTSIGLGLHHRMGFFQDDVKGRGFWSSISFPIESVRNKLKFEETILSDGGGVVAITDLAEGDVAYANMTEALQQSGWDFGKIVADSGCGDSCVSDKKTGVADIEFKIGYEWLEQSPCHLESYIGIKIPTGNKPTGEYLFEPVVGNGHHWGIMFGSAIGVAIYDNEAAQSSLRVETNMHSQYLFANTQCRSLDLVCKPWSRYMEMYRNIDQAIIASEIADADFAENFKTPGINVLTLPVKVRPGYSFNMNTAAVFALRKFQGEVGYNLYARQSECLKLACPWIEGPAIKNHAGLGKTDPIRDITGDFRKELQAETTPANAYLLELKDYKFNMIKESDLDLISASSPTAITSTIYGTLGYNWDERKNPLFASVGYSYEFSDSNNGIMERWTAWGKVGISY